MALTKEQIEWLHDHGKMPDWAYYQQNGKTAQENFILQRRIEIEQREAERRKREQEAQERKKLEKEFEAQV